MDLNKVTARIRPRTAYEAIDLGFLMVQHWWRDLFILWFALTLPFFLIFMGLLYNAPYWASMLVWWLKPVWETPLLHFLAQKLFDDSVTYKTILKEMPTLCRHHLIPKLTLRRVSFSRSFDMPVGELERLQGNDRNKRLNVLHRNTSSAAFWLTITGLHLEVILVFGMFGLLYLFMPTYIDYNVEFTDLLFDSTFDTAFIVAWYLAISLITPFYVASGFCLYINRRTLLEGWDIELAFKQIAQKAPKIITGAIAIGLMAHSLVAPPVAMASSSSTNPAISAPNRPLEDKQPLTPERSQSLIFEVLESDTFNRIKTVERWELKDDQKDEEDEPLFNKEWAEALEPIMTFFAETGEIIMWGLVIAVVIFLLLRYRHIDLSLLRKQTDDTPQAPEQLFGLDLRRGSLPDNPLQQAQLLWTQGQFRSAYSLLYRAALSHLVHDERVALSPSHTEGECVRLFQRTRKNRKAHYFGQLTEQWIALAYGHRPPTEQQFLQLCGEWDQHFFTQGSSHDEQ